MNGNGEAPVVVAESPVMRELLSVVSRLAERLSPVLIDGESGTGKDLVAHLLHYGGPRREGPFLKIHCPSIPEELAESELFGHERGAFTDAKQNKVGKIEMADGGTLYFDQIETLAPSLQAKLLRVVEEMRFERLGGTRTVSVDTRIVSSVTADLRLALRAGAFRDDLYHRLSVVPLTLAPLRERPLDILPLARHFLARERGHGTTTALDFEEQATHALSAYPWPGNVRELKAVVERAVLFAPGQTVPASALPAQVLESAPASGPNPQPTLRDIELAYIKQVLERTGGSQTGTARILGISRKALWEKRRRYGLP